MTRMLGSCERLTQSKSAPSCSQKKKVKSSEKMRIDLLAVFSLSRTTSLRFLFAFHLSFCCFLFLLNLTRLPNEQAELNLLVFAESRSQRGGRFSLSRELGTAQALLPSIRGRSIPQTPRRDSRLHAACPGYALPQYSLPC